MIELSWHALLRIARAPIALLIIAAVALLVPPQTNDMLEFLRDEHSGWTTFYVVLGFLGFSAWFWTRSAISAELDLPDARGSRVPARPDAGQRAIILANDRVVNVCALNVLPRLVYLLGVALGLGMLLRSSFLDASWIWFPAIGYLTLFLLLWFRLRLFGGLGGRDAAGRSPRHMPPWLHRHRPGVAQLLQRAPIATWLAAVLLYGGLLAFALGLAAGFLPVLRDPVFGTLADLFPGPTVAVLSLALMMGPFTMLSRVCDRFRLPRWICGVPTGFHLPVVAIAVVLIGVATAKFPLHTLRVPPDGSAVIKQQDTTFTDPRSPLGALFKAWRDNCVTGIARPRPIIVAISGGASRAGVAGAAVLQRLDALVAKDALRTGARIFAISSVSGGSLGAAAYLSLLAGQDNAADCPTLANWTAADARIVLAERLGKDALASVLAGALFGDIPRAAAAWPLWGHFLPDGGDRAEAIEHGFEHLWAGATKDVAAHGVHSIGFDRPFLSLFYETQPDGKMLVRKGMPIWIANGTDANTGARILTIPFRPLVDPLADLPKTWPFTAAGDLLAIAGHDVAISTAINNTARFPYLEPSGDLQRNGSVQLVDGGYFENQGLSTARNLESVLDDADPIVVQVTADSDPEITAPGQIIRCGIPPANPETTPPTRRPSQLLAPLLALYNVRGGHSEVALRDAETALCRTTPIRFFHFYLPARIVDGKPKEVPLNWVLSKDTADFIWDAMETDCNGTAACVGNSAEWQRLRDVLQ